MLMTTWRKRIEAAMRAHTEFRRVLNEDGGLDFDNVPVPDDPGPVLACTMTDAQLDEEFKDRYGHLEEQAFTAWTPTRVYFPAYYDGHGWVASAPRNPCDDATYRVGGG